MHLGKFLRRRESGGEEGKGRAEFGGKKKEIYLGKEQREWDKLYNLGGLLKFHFN